MIAVTVSTAGSCSRMAMSLSMAARVRLMEEASGSCTLTSNRPLSSSGTNPVGVTSTPRASAPSHARNSMTTSRSLRSTHCTPLS